MKKAVALALSSLLFSFGLSSCSPSSNELLDLFYGKLHEEDETSYFEEIDEDGLENLKSNPLSERFLLYYYEPTCEGCKVFSPILEKAAKEKNLLIYGLNSLSLSEDSAFKKKRYSTPSLIAYEDGNIKQSFSSGDYEEAFSNYSSFLSFYENHFKEPKALYLPLNKYEEFVSNEKSFIVEFMQQGCQYCQLTHQSFLNDYLASHDSMTYYILDKAEVLSHAEGDKDEYWNSFKVENGLTESWADGSKNPFGFINGRTPTFQYRKGDSILDAEIPYGTYDAESQQIVRKYYEDDLEIGTHFDSVSSYKENRRSFYSEKLKDFFDTNLKKVD